MIFRPTLHDKIGRIRPIVPITLHPSAFGCRDLERESRAAISSCTPKRSALGACRRGDPIMFCRRRIGLDAQTLFLRQGRS